MHNRDDDPSRFEPAFVLALVLIVLCLVAGTVEGPPS